MSDIKISLEKLQHLLNEQKELTAQRLLSETYLYNTGSTDGHSKSITIIDKDKFIKSALGAKYPSDIEVLKRYI